jgi:hypothetical protein
MTEGRRLPRGGMILTFKPVIMLVLIIIASAAFIEAQTTGKPSVKEQSLFGAEEETLDRPVKVPDGALELLRRDELVLQYLEAEKKSPDQLTAEPFLASEVHLDGAAETDLIVRGVGWLRGYVATFWVFRNLPGGYRLVLKATAAGLRVEHARWKGLRNISTASPIAGSSVEVVYRFDGKQYQYYRKKSEPIH